MLRVVEDHATMVKLTIKNEELDVVEEEWKIEEEKCDGVTKVLNEILEQSVEK